MKREFSKLLAIGFVCLAARGQTPKPAFEAASIKPPTPLGPLGMRSDVHGGPGTPDPGMYSCQNCPVYWLVSGAYNIRIQTLFSGPDWLHEVRFDFSAKIPAGATKETFRLMLQNLLAERFKMAVHREKKQMQVYELTVAKNGPKFKESVPKDAPNKDDGPPQKIKTDGDGFPILTPGMTMAAIPGHARFGAQNQPMDWLIDMLSGQLASPITDATGLTGKYDFLVSWAFEDHSSSTPPPIGGAPPAAEFEQYLPALISSVQSQLGLKLTAKKGLAEVLVVDHIEKSPTGN